MRSIMHKIRRRRRGSRRSLFRIVHARGAIPKRRRERSSIDLTEIKRNF